MFDTGADNVISPELAGELAIKLLKPNVPSQLRGNALKIRYAQIDNVQLGGATLANQYFKIIQPPQYNQRHKIQGLIGYEFLARFEVTLDYAHSQLILRIPTRLSSQSSSDPKGFPIHILFDNISAVIPCELSRVPAYCGIDTGAALGVIVTKQFGDEHPGILSDIFATDYLYGIGDRARTRYGMLDSVEIAGTTIRHEVTGFSEASHGELAGTHYFDADWKPGAAAIYGDVRLSRCQVVSGAERECRRTRWWLE